MLFLDEAPDTGLENLSLYGTYQYTVFSPDDDAFEDLYIAPGVRNLRDLPVKLVLNVLF